MRLRKSPIFFVLLLTGGAAAVAVGRSEDSGLRIAGVQLLIDESCYATEAAFEAAVEARLRKALESGEIDLVVFPEYTSVFLALTPYSEIIEASSTVPEALGQITRIHPLLTDPKSIFTAASPRVAAAMDRIWGGLARRYDVAIIAGTWFAAEPDGLKNRLAVYGRDGRRAYEQDKVYLTDFEIDIVGLSSGRVTDARAFSLDGFSVATTVCRDTFFETWDEHFSGADYWLDIKANGARFTSQESERFLRALPARITESDVRRGMTVCLTGSYLDLLWEGRSFVVVEDVDGAKIGKAASIHLGDAVLVDEVRNAPVTAR